MKRNPEMSRYGCMRTLTKPWARNIRRVAPLALSQNGDRLIPSTYITGDLVINPLVIAARGLEPGLKAAVMAHASVEASLAQMHMYWERFGRNIFELSPKLVSAFRLTDVAHSSFDGLNYPHNAFYIHFGVQADLVMPTEPDSGDGYIDGAYVIRAKDGAPSICFMLSNGSGGPSAWPGILALIDGAHTNLCAIDAIDASIDNVVRSLGEFRDRICRYGDDASIIALDKSIDKIQDSRDVLRRAATLISNALFYLSEPQDDLTTKVEEGAPQSLADAALHGAPNKMRKARQSLTAEGYAVINYCGARFSLHGDEGDGTGEAKASHWRRGHWRNQPVGPRGEQIKRIWIRPVLVNAHVGEPGRGRVYLVGEQGGADSVVNLKGRP